MVANLALAGWAAGQQWPFYAALAASSTHLGWQVATLRTEDAEDCWHKFQSNQWIGATMLTGIVLGNLLKNGRKRGGDDELEEEEEEGQDELDRLSRRLERRNLNVNFYT